MRSHEWRVLIAGMVGTMAAPWVARAQETKPAPPRAADRAPVDVGLEAMRREVEAKEREWERRFAQASELQIGAELRLVRLDIGVNGQLPNVLIPRRGDERFDVLVRRGDEALVIAFPDAVVVPETYDLLVYGNSSSVTLRQRLDRILETKIQQARRDLSLSAADESKLQLAGQGDIKRLFDKLESRRAEFNVARRDRKQLAAFVEKLDAMKREMNFDLFADGSLYSKTLRKILSDH